MSGEYLQDDFVAEPQRKLRILLAGTGRNRSERDFRKIADYLREDGFEVFCTGCYHTPDQIVSAAIREDADLIGLSILPDRRSLFRQKISAFLSDDADEVPERVGGFFMLADLPGLTIGIKQIFVPGAKLQDIGDWIRCNFATRDSWAQIGEMFGTLSESLEMS